MPYILAIDQGTSSSRCIIYDDQAKPLAIAQQEVKSLFPQPGWVEQDAEKIWQTQVWAFKQALQQIQLQTTDIAAIGITNQRETTVVWERSTGKPVYNAIVWQDSRTADACMRLKEAGLETMISAKTGLLIDAYFSATKLQWILDNVEGARSKAERGELAFGTIDSWLVWNLTNGEQHITDVSNASRTLLYNIETLHWDQDLLSLFNIPASMLPAVKSSCEIYARTRNLKVGAGIPLAAIAGDQQAALFGQLCIEKGMAKCTYGTGSFLMMNTGSQKIASKHRLLSTIAWQIGAQVTYALEGSVFTSGAVIQWLRDGLQLFEQAADSESLAASVNDNGGVYFVPALTGLGAPHWDPDARGAIFGISRSTTSAHLTRAALEGIGFQVDELLEIFAKESGAALAQLRIDGGAAKNNLLAQFQADLSGIPIIRPANIETTALGAAYLAGIGIGLWNMAELNQKWRIDHSFNRTLQPQQVLVLKQNWLKALARTKNWTT